MNKMWDFICEHRKEITELENKRVYIPKMNNITCVENLEQIHKSATLTEAVQLIIDYLDIKYEDIKKTPAKLTKKGTK